MNNDDVLNNNRKMTSVFERFLSLWVVLCIIAGILLGKIAPNLAQSLDSLAIYVKGAPVVSIPIAVCLFFMMYPIMVKIDFSEVVKAGKSGKPVFLTLFINWAVKPFTMYGISIFFLGTLFYNFIGPEAVDQVKMPFGLDLPVGATWRLGMGGQYEASEALTLNGGYTLAWMGDLDVDQDQGLRGGRVVKLSRTEIRSHHRSRRVAGRTPRWWPPTRSFGSLRASTTTRAYTPTTATSSNTRTTK